MPHKLRYDWDAIQKYYDEDHSIRECYDKFGFGRTAVSKAVKKGRLKTRSKSESHKVAVKSGRHKQNWTDESREKCRKAAIQRDLGGNRNSHRINYKGVMLDSTYELRVAEIMDRDGIEWAKPKTRFVWTDKKNKDHRYSPDFFLPQFELYLDPKNDWLIKRDRYKIDKVQKQNGVTVKIVGIEIIKQWEQKEFEISIL